LQTSFHPSPLPGLGIQDFYIPYLLDLLGP
jgi:hypothetical protein